MEGQASKGVESVRCESQHKPFESSRQKGLLGDLTVEGKAKRAQREGRDRRVGTHAVSSRERIGLGCCCWWDICTLEQSPFVGAVTILMTDTWTENGSSCCCVVQGKRVGV